MATKIRQTKTNVFRAILFTCGIFLFGRLLANNTTYPPSAELLQKAIQQYTEIEKRGGWQKVILSKKQYKKGDSTIVVKQIKLRLQASGDLTEKDTSLVFTKELESAVRTVQRQFGFTENGIVDAALAEELNVPVEKRIAQMQANLERLRTATTQITGKRIVVNVPEYMLYVYEDATPVLQMKVVVGSVENKTPIFNDELTHIIFSPYWNVPAKIVREEILPAMKKNRHYLAAHNYEVIGHVDGLPDIRQRPGNENSLGLVKFLFPNDHDVYFHDTPAKSLFNQRIRAYSHGCIRLSNPTALAEYLLKDNPNWTLTKIIDAMNAGKEQWVKLNTSVPVQIIYTTAWVDEQGQLNFRDDIYDYDKSLPLASNE